MTPTGHSPPQKAAAAASLLAALALSACGGSSGPGPVSASAIAPPPAPVMVPVPTASLDTAEYRRSSAALASGVIEAWATGASGQSVIIGTVDSGIASASPEFAGRIHAASRDVSGSGRSIQDEGGHGTSVAAILAAARNTTQIVGIAPEATLAVMRADRAGTCASADGCRYTDATLAAGIDAAATAGAKVINISLGGSPGSTPLRSAFASATRTAVLVISGGNDSAAQIDLLPEAALASGLRSAIIVVGALDENRQLASFSNKAGTAQDNFLTALGVRVRSFDETGAAFLYSGTSYSAPQVSGAIALLAQAFPSLTPSQLVDILLRSADDAGAPGTDPVYGRGILNIARAFAPAGSTSLAGSTIPVSLTANGTLGSAMGAGTSFGSALGAVPITDSYGRSYALQIGATLRPASPARLGPALAATTLAQANTSARAGPFGLALSLRAERQAQPTRHADSFRTTTPVDAPLGFAQRGLDAHAASNTPLREARFTFGTDSARIAIATGRLAAAALPASAVSGLIAPDGLEADADPARSARTLVMLETRQGNARLAFAASSGAIALPQTIALGTPARQTRLTASLSAPAGPLSLGARLTHITDRGSLLGTRLAPAFGLLGGTAVLVGGSIDAVLLPNLTLRAAATLGQHSPHLATTGLLRPGTTLHSSSWSLAATTRVRQTGHLTLTLAQPHALTSGSLLSASGTPLPLAPEARERAAELAYTTGPLTLTLFHRQNPGHHPRPADSGAAIALSTAF